jgi:ATP-dependent RNA helicase RhlE
MSYAYKTRRNSAAVGNFSGGRRRHQRAPKSGGHKKYIDPAKFVKAATAPSDVVEYTPQNLFSDFSLNLRLQANLEAKGYVTPSPIQDQSIPAALAGQDIIGIASTGTGKTAAFALPVLERLINEKESGAGAIIIAPTRELAQQIEEECRSLGKGTGLRGALLIGGSSMGTQLRDLKGKPSIVIGTPGRIKDHLERGSLNLKFFNMVVLDEVDRMLDMGFVNDVTEILRHMPPTRQSFFFSATIDARVRTLIDNFTADPLTVSLKASSASENVHQDVVKYDGKTDKLAKLHDILINQEVGKVIVFDETQRNVERLGDELLARGFKADAIHGGKSQGQRKRALDRFKSNQVKVLVATDVAARGIDVADITHVINFSVPNDYEDYIHRIGRAGRAGRIGYALTFIDK